MAHENSTSTSFDDAKCYTVTLAFFFKFFFNKMFLKLIPHTGLQCFLFTRYLPPPFPTCHHIHSRPLKL